MGIFAIEDLRTLLLCCLGTGMAIFYLNFVSSPILVSFCQIHNFMFSTFCPSLPLCTLLLIPCPGISRFLRSFSSTVEPWFAAQRAVGGSALLEVEYGKGGGSGTDNRIALEQVSTDIHCYYTSQQILDILIDR